MSSYRDINYSLRPAKNIERKMLLEAFRKLIFIDDLQNYRYIGFGSTYFTDFELFHRELNILDMKSIERDTSNKLRFKFNRPYSNVDIEFGESNYILPKLFGKKNNDKNDKKDKKDIIWLDYDGMLKSSVLEDIDTIISNVQIGSIFLLSINVSSPKVILCDEDKINLKKMQGKQKEALNQLNKQLNIKIDINKVLDPQKPQNNIFQKWNFAKVCKELINEQIDKSINSRLERYGNGLEYKQLFHFYYEDNAKMLTVGGIIFDETLKNTIETKCGFEKLFFIKTDCLSFIKSKCFKWSINKNYLSLLNYQYSFYKFCKDYNKAFLIESPNLTYREIKYLNKYMSMDISQMPKDNAGKKIDSIIPKNDIEKFHKVYRYFPTFTEANL